MGIWSRVFVPRVVNCACANGVLSSYRQQIVPQAFGHVLEIGCGGGQNFPFYTAENVTRLTAIDPDGVMIKTAQKKAKNQSQFPIKLVQTGAENLPFKDHAFDCVVFTFVLCTIPDWRAALLDIKRVLKPGGKVLFCEHGLAPDMSVEKWQRRLEPIWKPLAGGCHLTRNTADMFSESGFKMAQIEDGYIRKAPKFAGYITRGEAVQRQT